MRLEELKELHYITPVENIPSILDKGLLSFNKAKKVKHTTCANAEVQERREKVVIPSGRPLHDYVNLYFNSRNPMMYFRREDHSELTVLSVSTTVIDLPGVVISDCNASRDLALFKPAPEGLDMIDSDMVFAEYWTHDNQITEYTHKGMMCSEVLVPEIINPKYIIKAYASCEESLANLVQILDTTDNDLPIVKNGYLFFR